MQITESEVGCVVRTQRWKCGVIVPNKEAWEDAASDRYGEAYLYDLLADPYELENLIGFEGYREASTRCEPVFYGAWWKRAKRSQRLCSHRRESAANEGFLQGMYRCK